MYLSLLSSLLGAHIADIPVSHPPVEIFAMQELPLMGSRAYLIGEVGSGDILVEEGAELVVPMASLTKIMTVTVALEHYSPEEEVIIRREAATIEGAQVHLLQGDTVRVRDLIAASLIRSGNDAAMALAEHAPGGKSQFIRWMNEKAASLGLAGTSFTNPMGFDEPGHASTAEDLFQLARYALTKHPELRELARTRVGSITSTQGKPYTFETTNALLGKLDFMEVEGLKTGTTDLAGESFIGLTRGENGKEYLVVLLNSPDRFAEAKWGLWWALSRSR